MKSDLTRFKEKELGDRIDRGSVLAVRLDGKGFSKLKRKFGWDKEDSLNDKFVEAMLSLTKKMCDEYRPDVAFVGSDEISMVFVNHGNSEHPFGGKIHKVCSLMAAFCSVWANSIFRESGLSDVEEVILFDCRAFPLDSKEEALLYIDSRAFDVHRNCMRSQAGKFLSHKQLMGVKSVDLYGFAALHNMIHVFEDRHLEYCGHTFSRVESSMKLSEKLGDRMQDLINSGYIDGDRDIVTSSYESAPVTKFRHKQEL